MNIGTRKIVVDEAIAQLRLYAETNGAVLQYYDGLPGMTCVGGSDPNQVTLEDLARTMVVGADLRAGHPLAARGRGGEGVPRDPGRRAARGREAGQ